LILNHRANTSTLGRVSQTLMKLLLDARALSHQADRCEKFQWIWNAKL